MKKTKIKKNKIKDEEVEAELKKSDLGDLPKFLIVAAVVVIGFFLLVLPTKTITCSMTDTIMEEVPYTEKEGRYVGKPYTYSDCVNKNLLYGLEWSSYPSSCINNVCVNHEQVCVKKNFWGNCVEFRENCIQYQCQMWRQYCNLIVENKDDVDGYFSIVGKRGSGAFVGAVGKWVDARSEETFTWTFTYTNPDETGCTYSMSTIPTKSVCTDKIGYKPEYVEEDVIKWKQEPKTVIKPYDKRVNWLFGSC